MRKGLPGGAEPPLSPHWSFQSNHTPIIYLLNPNYHQTCSREKELYKAKKLLLLPKTPKEEAYNGGQIVYNYQLCCNLAVIDNKKALCHRHHQSLQCNCNGRSSDIGRKAICKETSRKTFHLIRSGHETLHPSMKWTITRSKCFSLGQQFIGREQRTYFPSNVSLSNKNGVHSFNVNTRSFSCMHQAMKFYTRTLLASEQKRVSCVSMLLWKLKGSISEEDNESSQQQSVLMNNPVLLQDVYSIQPIDFFFVKIESITVTRERFKA